MARNLWHHAWGRICAAVIIASIMALTAFTGVSPMGTASAQTMNDDTTPPVYQSLSVSPTSVVAGGIVTFTAHITDDSSGVSGTPYILITGPGWNGGNNAPAPTNRAEAKAAAELTGAALYGLFHMIAGTPQDGIYAADVAVPPVYAVGTYTVRFLAARDEAGNFGLVRAPSPPAGGVSFTVTDGVTDTTPPAFQSLSVSPTSVAPGGTVTFTAHITDDSSGVSGTPYIAVARTGAAGTVKSAFTELHGAFHLSSGTPQDGTYTADIAVPATAGSGTYSVQYLVAQDAAGNFTLVRAPTPPTGGVTFTVAGTPPNQPTNLHVTGATSSSVSFAWTPPDATSGIVASNGVQANDLGIAASSYTLSGLAPGAWTCISVAAYNNSGASTWTGWVCGQAGVAPPAKPTNVHVTGATSSSVSFAWTPPDATSGIVASNGVQANDLGIAASSYTLSGLAPGAWTCISVAAYNTAGPSPWTAWSCGQAGAGSAPTMPTNVHVTGTTASSVNFAWTPPDATSHIVVSNGSRVSDLGVASTSYSQSGLAAGTWACVSVAAYNAAGASPWTGWVCGQAGVVTGARGAPPKPQPPTGAVTPGTKP